MRLDLNKGFGVNGCPFDSDCDSCTALGGSVVCHCLGVTEDVVVSALITLELRNLRDVRRHTGAGSGCNACHCRIQSLLENYSSSSSPEICSAR